MTLRRAAIGKHQRVRQSGRETDEEKLLRIIQGIIQGILDPKEGGDREAPAGAALEPLTADLLKARVVEIFPIGYLTLMAIIQGAAFGALFIAIAQGRFFAHGWDLRTWMILAQALATGLTIVIVTHQYLLLTVVVRWTPTMFDTLIPYLLGFGEIWMTTATGSGTSWWAALSAVCAVAACAFWHTRSRTTQDAFPGKLDIYQENHRYVATQTLVCVGMLLASLAASLLNAYGSYPVLLNIWMTPVVTLMGIVILMLGARNQNNLYDAYLVQRWHWPYRLDTLALSRSSDNEVASSPTRQPAHTEPRPGP